jgi:uncharacterized protein YlxW (UPF0749 family)
MSDSITKARQFLKSFLERNNTHLAEHSAVVALAEYADSFEKFNDNEEEILKLEDLLNEERANNGELDIKVRELEKTVASLTSERDVLKGEVAKKKTEPKESVGPGPKQPVSGSNA